MPRRKAADDDEGDAIDDTGALAYVKQGSSEVEEESEVRAKKGVLVAEYI